MKMRNGRIWWPFLYGLVGFALRTMENMKFDVLTGLPVESIWHIVVGAYVLAAIPIVLLINKKQWPVPTDATYLCSFQMASKRATTAFVLGTLFAIAQVVYSITHFHQGKQLFVEKIFMFLLILAILCECTMVVHGLQRRKTKSPLSLASLLMVSVALILHYMVNGNNPFIIAYYIQDLALVAFILQFYFRADYLYSRARPKWYALGNGLSIVYGTMAIADGNSIPGRFFYIAIVLLSLAQVGAYCRNEHRNFIPKEIWG